MTRTSLRALAALALATTPLAAGCVAHHGPAALTVEASIASVTLAQDCPAAERGAPGLIGADCEAGADDCGFCQQSSLQLHLEAIGEGAEVPFEIVSIRVTDPEAVLVGTLDARNPRVFEADGYAAWDETLAPGDDLDVSYDTTAPDWYGTSGARFGWGTVYRVEVVVRIDGVERTLSADAMREPEIVT
jgi:hypothetical protein